MRKTFPGYYRPTEEEFKKLWDECIFVFDTNILLNLYRYSSETAEEFIGLMREISDRIWIPHQVGYEYQKDRLEVIEAEGKSYDKLIELLAKTHEDLVSGLSSKRHPYLKDSDKKMGKLGQIFDEIKSQLNEKKSEYVKLNDSDNIRDQLTELFEGKVGSPYSVQKLDEICKTGKKRYDKRTPPGYMDPKKMEPEKYGDLILWFQTIDKVKEEDRPIILITDEKKEDWWLIHKGKRIGPRPELIQEMITETESPCYIYRSKLFIENAEKYLQKEITQNAVREVRERDEEEQLHEKMTFSDKVDIEVFRPSASDFVDALNLDAIEYAMDSSKNSEELIKNMGAINQLRNALAHSSRAKRIIQQALPSYKAARILESMDASRAAKILEKMDHAEEVRNLAANRFLSDEDIKNMNALSKMSEAMHKIKSAKHRNEEFQKENQIEEKTDET